MSNQAQILDGKAVAKEILDAAALMVQQIKTRTGVTPCLATVLVGDDPASVTYTRMKRKRCEDAGMKSMKVELPDGTTTEQLVAAIEELSNDPDVHGILLQHPAPVDDERAAFEAIAAAKDVDGVTTASFAAISFPEDKLVGYGSCTPAGMVRLLAHYKLDIKGRHAVVIGRSAILGKPLAMMLLARHATVTICHSRTQGLADIVRTADIVCACVGRPEFVKGDWIKPGAVVLDAGYNEGNVGDCDIAGCSQVASWITPVPGGVGPMTIATLIEQTALGAARQLGVELE